LERETLTIHDSIVLSF